RGSAGPGEPAVESECPGRRQPVNPQGKREKGKGEEKGRRALRLVPWSLVLVPWCLGLAGCVNLYDEVTSRNFNVKSWFVRPNPLVVLEKSTDGTERARALRSLKEPPAGGKYQQEHELSVRILTAAATTERQPLCRLAAIQTLAGYKDPR